MYVRAASRRADAWKFPVRFAEMSMFYRNRTDDWHSVTLRRGHLDGFATFIFTYEGNIQRIDPDDPPMNAPAT